MITIYKGRFLTIEGTFSPSSVYRGEKNAIRVEWVNGSHVTFTVSIKYGSVTKFSAKYYSRLIGGKSSVEIDLTDIMRMLYDSIGNGPYTLAIGATEYEGYSESVNFTIADGEYDIAHVLRPGVWFDAPSYRSYLNRGFGDYEDVSAPSRMIINPSSSMPVWLANTTYDKTFLYTDATGLHETANNSDGAAVVPYNAVAAAVPFPGGEKYNVAIDRDTCRPLRMFRWVFPSGETMQFWLRVYNVTDSTGNSQELMSEVENYDVRKGLLQTLEVGMDSLTAYDLWYYGTMMTSSKVEMYRANTKDWERVNVTTKKLELTPTSDGELKKLRLDVELLEHDAI